MPVRVTHFLNMTINNNNNNNNNNIWSSLAGPLPDPLPGKQSFWGKPGLLTDRALIESSLVEPSQRARFLAAQAPHSGDWLLALPIANCGLRLDDEAVRVAVGMRLGQWGSVCAFHTTVTVGP